MANNINPVNVSTSYILALNNCANFATILAGSATAPKNISVSDARRDSGDPNTCLFDFSLSGSDQYAPFARITAVDGSVSEYSEAFTYDDQAPVIHFKNVSISGVGSQQRLSVVVDAADDTDIQYVAFNLTGLRASDIRAAGGVISEAKKRHLHRQILLSAYIPLVTDSQSTHFRFQSRTH